MNKAAELREQWNTVYENFDYGRKSVWREHASPFFVKQIDYLKKQGVKKVLDAGCGDGRNLVEFAKAGFEVTGVDLSDIALEKCGELCREQGKVNLARQDLENLKFDNGSFGAVVCDFTTAHMENPGIVIQNFYNVLKTSGIALIEFTSTKDPNSGQGKKIGENEYMQNWVYLRFYTKKEVEKLMGRFKIISIDSAYYTDPNHGTGYHREKRHKHHSFFVTAQKE